MPDPGRYVSNAENRVRRRERRELAKNPAVVAAFVGAAAPVPGATAARAPHPRRSSSAALWRANLSHVPGVDVARLIIDESIETKINRKHPPLTGQEVREAVVYAKNAQARWDDDGEHGLRLIVRGKTYRGRSVIAYLMPVNDDDPEEGTFVLKTAMVEES